MNSDHNSSSRLMLGHDKSILRKRDESNYNAFYENLDSIPKRSDNLVSIDRKDQRKAQEDEDATVVNEIQIVSKTLDVCLF